MYILLFSLFVTVADRLVKHLSVKHLKPAGTVELIPGVFSLSYVENRGAAFGILQNHRWLFIVLTIAISAGIAGYLIMHPKDDILRRLSLAAILGGALGNLIDRILYGYVVDMLHATFINFPVFNIADTAVVCGTFLLAYQLLFRDSAGLNAKAS
jgi:signal peptidase II